MVSVNALPPSSSPTLLGDPPVTTQTVDVKEGPQPVKLTAQGLGHRRYVRDAGAGPLDASALRCRTGDRLSGSASPNIARCRSRVPPPWCARHALSPRQLAAQSGEDAKIVVARLMSASQSTNTPAATRILLSGQRRLTSEIRDLYCIVDGMQARAASSDRRRGAGPTAGLAADAKTAGAHSGIVTLAPTDQRNQFDIPEFAVHRPRHCGGVDSTKLGRHDHVTCATRGADGDAARFLLTGTRQMSSDLDNVEAPRHYTSREDLGPVK